jgi:hypothetical protein
MKKIKVNDRVRRVPYTVTVSTGGNDLEPRLDGEGLTTAISTRGCAGTVKALREETTNSSAETRERSIMIQVLWDNGTLSFHGPAGLELDS